MKRYVLMFEYDSKKFMDIEKIIIFNENLKRVEEKENRISMFFYGDTSNEELATFMSYFNNLVKKEICNLSISLKTKEVIFEKGINNKSIKLSAQNARDIKNKKFDNIINEYYCDNEDDVEIKLLPTKNWESIILDLIGE